MDRTKEAERLLRYLGANSAYCGLRQTAWAIALVMEDRKRLEHITKGLYQEVAKEFRTGWKNVERNIRTVADAIWKNGERPLLLEISGKKIKSRPTNTEFLDILAVYLMQLEYEQSTEKEEDAGALELLASLQTHNIREIVGSLNDKLEALEGEIVRLSEIIEKKMKA